MRYYGFHFTICAAAGGGMEITMEQLKKIGSIKPKSSKEIPFSKISLGFEKLDRAVFDPAKTYDHVASLGVKLARIQSGWARTEKEKGIYSFEWLDEIVENFVSRGIEPWLCLCYGNALYTPAAEKVFGAVGCPPIHTEEEIRGWESYVKAVATRYAGKVNYFEIWNEPDWTGFWKHGVNPTEFGEFTNTTAKYIREVRPDAKIIGGVLSGRNLHFLTAALEAGLADNIDFLSFHEYTADERDVFEKVDSYRALIKLYNPKVELIQGESGSQSRSGGHGALWTGSWTEEKQAKQLARHTIADFITDVHFTSYFTCVDMVEAINGTVGDKISFSDFGYFGVLGQDFDENGDPLGNYRRKPSYYVLQNICSVFVGDFKPCTIPTFVYSRNSERFWDIQPKRYELTTGSFENEHGKMFAYWYPSNIMSTSFFGSITLEIYTEQREMKLIDVMDGSIYEIPENMLEDKGDGVYVIKELPVKDTPLLLMLGDFYRE